MITRRHAIGLTALGGAGLAWGLTNDRVAATSAQGAGRPRAEFPEGSVIRTLLSDVPPDALAGGPVLFHEHLSINLSQSGAAHYTGDVALMVEEARGARRDGIACLVDGGHADMRRDLDALRRITRESGMPVVASGGYYMQRTYPPQVAAMTADRIADNLASEATRERLGAFGEIGQQGGVMTADERKVFQAIARAHLRTGLPVFTHNAYTGKRQVPVPVPRDTALRQLDLLEAEGAQPQHLAIGHVCCLDDPAADVAIALARRGAFVGFDRVTLEGIIPDADRVVMIMAMVDAGYADRVLIASDFYSERALKKNGGPGLGQAATVFGPKLLAAGLPQDTLTQILVDNPRRFLAFVPPTDRR